jgi:hypothetical protein
MLRGFLSGVPSDISASEFRSWDKAAALLNSSFGDRVEECKRALLSYLIAAKHERKTVVGTAHLGTATRS